jgi:serine/threonine protein kinase
LANGRYEFNKVMGRGVEGEVFRAKDILTNQMVAVKRIDIFEQSTASLKHVLREVQILRNLTQINP